MRFIQKRFLREISKNTLCVFLIFASGSGVCHAQTTYLKWKKEAVYGIGTCHYFGDMGGKQLGGASFGTDEFDMKNLRPVVRIGIKQNILGWLAINSQLSYTRINQDDSKSAKIWQHARNLQFSTNIVEASVIAETRLWYKNFKFNNKKSFVEYYVALGAGLFYYNPTTKYEGKKYNLRQVGTEGQGLIPNSKTYSIVAACLPVGGGFRFGLSSRTTLFLEAVYRYTTTDYIDDVSSNYPDFYKLTGSENTLASKLSYRGNDAYPAGSRRGNPSVKDSYVFFQIGLSKAIGNGRLSRL
ncbi:MAG: hypothetical protein H6607_09295 [Flavobacteriales bacterium]|nr:hypothetical protein [Flavobacteriales bacterium]